MKLTRSTILLMRRMSAAALLCAIGCAILSTIVIATHLVEFAVRGTITHVTIGDLLGAEARWLYTPICLAGPVLAFLALYAFFALWSYAVRKDMERDAGPDRADPPAA